MRRRRNRRLGESARGPQTGDFERLEPRAVLSGNPLSARIWTISGDRDAERPDDVIVVERNPAVPGQLRAVVNGSVVSTRPEAFVRTLRINGGRGDDTITVNIPGNGRIGAVIYGGAGNDTITGGDGNDIIYGGAGRDTIVGGRGDDRVWGDGDDDSLAGSAGNDYLDGGAGVDVIRGGGGRNTLVGGAGVDMLHGNPRLDRVRLDVGEQLIGDESTNPLQVAADSTALGSWYVAAGLAAWGDRLGKRAGWGGPIMLADGVAVSAAGTAPGNAALVRQAMADFDGTNNQVAGVDEGDLVKTDGTHIFTLAGDGVDIITAVPAESAAVVSHLGLPGQELAIFLQGTRLTVIGQQSGWYADGGPVTASSGVSAAWLPWYGGTWKSQVTVTVVDVTDVAQPTVLETTSLDGWFLDARATGGRVLVVTQDTVDIPSPAVLPTPPATIDLPPTGQIGGGDAIGIAMVAMPDFRWGGRWGVYEDAAAYRARLESAWAAGPLPTFSVTTAAGTVKTGSLVEPGRAYVPLDATADASMLSLTAFTVDDDVPGFDAVTSVSGVSGTIYASTTSLYVAATHWGAWWDPTDAGETTNVYKFDIADPAVPLTAMGAVPGSVLNQMSLDEHDGLLRVATTSRDRSGSSNGVFVLGEQNGNLSVVGSVTNLAAGERIYSVRFVGDTGYVCTFRQVDPLFVIDLADPTAPRVTGELKIPGYSSILQPLDATHVLGIGRDVDPDTGRVLGLQLSLFDVGDPTAPRRTATYTFAGNGWQSWSPALWDHKALSWFPSHGIVTLPVEQGDWWSGTSGLFVFRADVGSGTLKNLGEVASSAPVQRSVRIGESLYTISSTEVIVTRLETPSDTVARVSLTRPADDPFVIQPL